MAKRFTFVKDEKAFDGVVAGRTMPALINEIENVGMSPRAHEDLAGLAVPANEALLTAILDILNQINVKRSSHDTRLRDLGKEVIDGYHGDPIFELYTMREDKIAMHELAIARLMALVNVHSAALNKFFDYTENMSDTLYNHALMEKEIKLLELKIKDKEGDHLRELEMLKNAWKTSADASRDAMKIEFREFL